jgi:glycosyltransferase involved in cell wall biosynthesis
MNGVQSGGSRRLSLLVCSRQVPAVAGTQSEEVMTLRELGHDVDVVADGPVALDRYEAIILLGNPSYFPKLRRQIRTLGKARRPVVAALHAEPLPPPRASGLPRWSPLNISEIGKIVLRDWRATDTCTNHFKLRSMMREGTIDLLFVTSPEKQEYADEEGYKSWLVLWGYHPVTGRLLGLERDVDVLFLGDTRPRRRRKLLKRLADAGIPVTVMGSWLPGGKGLWGEERVRFLNRTKIIVHLQRYPGKVAAMRFIIAMANGVLVISEPSYKPEPFVDGEHYVVATVDEMPEKIRYYLAHPEERERITRSAYRLVTEELTFHRSLGRMMSVITDAVSK